ncbi:hypothetical protein NUW58_g10919 [Xylaria curta]|uniref:Uncharacterized protein n=1 Tax=Xylaria curta TaxID=42375 RepID=A0ACC1MG99_9PEZI|nr:hypothetical protein NUW58_g10919 [Xylaria curta]
MLSGFSFLAGRLRLAAGAAAGRVHRRLVEAHGQGGLRRAHQAHQSPRAHRRRLGVKMSTLALAWVLKNPNVSSAIIGASSAEQVYENVRAVAVVDKLTPEILAKIDDILNNKPPAIQARF